MTKQERTLDVFRRLQELVQDEETIVLFRGSRVVEVDVRPRQVTFHFRSSRGMSTLLDEADLAKHRELSVGLRVFKATPDINPLADLDEISRG